MKRKLIFILLIGLIFCGGCNTSSATGTPTATLQELPTVAIPTATETPLATDVPTIAPTSTATPSPVPTATPVPTNTPSWQEVGASSASGGGISNNAGSSYVPSLAISPDGTPYIAWSDDSSGNNEIYVLAWNGSVWAEVGAGSASGGGISNNAGSSNDPFLAIAPDGMPYVAWYDESGGNWEIYVLAWNGSSWVEVGVGSASGDGISNTAEDSARPSLAIAPDGTPYVAWYDDINKREIYVRTWDGSSWVEVGAGSASGGGISNTGGDEPSLAIAPDGTPYVAWFSNNGGNHEIYVRAWDGTSWAEVGTGSASGGGISNTTGDSRYPFLTIAPDGTPYVAWWDDSSGNNEIYLLTWNGNSWEEVGVGSASGGGISNTAGDSGIPSVVVAPDGTPYIAWPDESSGNHEIYILTWIENGWEEVGIGSASGGGISNSTGSSYGPFLAIAPDGTLYVAWMDDSSGNYEIYIQRYFE